MGHGSPRFGCRRSVPCVVTAIPQWHQSILLGMGTRVGRQSDAHSSHPPHATTTKTDTRGGAPPTLRTKIRSRHKQLMSDGWTSTILPSTPPKKIDNTIHLTTIAEQPHPLYKLGSTAAGVRTKNTRAGGADLMDGWMECLFHFPPSTSTQKNQQHYLPYYHRRAAPSAEEIGLGSDLRPQKHYQSRGSRI